MNRVRLLCNMNRVMMETFSQHTVARLKTHTLFRLALPPFQSFLAINVNKEIEKDRQVISQAATLYQAGGQPEAAHVDVLLQQARLVDQDFLRQATVFPIDIRIQYQDIERYRQQRIALLLHTSYRILAQWQDSHSFRKSVQQQYTETQFRDVLHDILQLYTRETRMLSRSIRIPHLLSLARDKVTQTITDTMLLEATALASTLARTVYRR